jgi:hypothetical protein
MSDLHVEFAAFHPPPVAADVVVLAGDIGVRLGGLSWAKATFPDTPVVYVPGNHEYYGSAIPHFTEKLRAAALGSGVHVLDKDAIVLGGVRFLGATLWTDFGVHGADQRDVAGELARAGMSDFTRIRVSPRFSRITPRAMAGLHQQARSWLTERLAEDFAGPTVVITHHAPSLRGVVPEYRGDPLTAAYASRLDHLLDGRPRAWIFGHTHHSVDEMIDGTRLVSNQRGYPGEPGVQFDPARVIEV